MLKKLQNEAVKGTEILHKKEGGNDKRMDME
jgi:hypothetical protein